MRTFLRDHWAVGLIFLAAVLLRLQGAAVYPLAAQHDARHHLRYVAELYNGRFTKNYEGPYYYGLVALSAHLSKAVICRQQSGCSAEPPLQVAAIITNLAIFMLYLAGILALGFSWKLNKLAHLFFFGFAASSPVVHRSFNMVRPENLMLCLAVWGSVLMSYCHSSRRGWIRGALLLGSSALFALLAAQKVSGLTALAAALIILLAYELPYRGISWAVFRQAAMFMLAAILLLCSLWVVNFKMSGSLFYKHHYSCSNCAPQSVLPFIRFDPLAAWQNPFRNAHFNAAPNIFAIDLFGDYWRYGFDRRHLLEKERPVRLQRARFGLMLGGLFIFCNVVGFWVVFRTRSHCAPTRPFVPLAHLTFPVFGYLFLVAASYLVHYGVQKFDIMKWEYLLWGVPFLCMPMVAAVQLIAKRWRVFWIVPSAVIIVGGFLQSIL